jgi:fructuronate reductase
MRYALGRRENGETYALRDPREKEIATVLGKAGSDAGAIADALFALPGLFPSVISGNMALTDAVKRRLALMVEKGTRAAIDGEER